MVSSIGLSQFFQDHFALTINKDLSLGQVSNRVFPSTLKSLPSSNQNPAVCSYNVSSKFSGFILDNITLSILLMFILFLPLSAQDTSCMVPSNSRLNLIYHSSSCPWFLDHIPDSIPTTLITFLVPYPAFLLVFLFSFDFCYAFGIV